MAKKKDIDDEVLGEGNNKKDLTIEMIRKIMNKEAGKIIAYNLDEDDPTTVKGWIPTGSRWLDSIIARGMLAGIPMGRIIEIAGLEASGKSYLAAQIAANAMKMGIKVVYFDSESAIDKEFWRRMGIDISQIIYTQAETTESVLETMEKLMTLGVPMLFVWDSLAQTATKKRLEIEGFDPQAMMAMQARILGEGFRKLTIPLANTNCTFLVLNQLKYKIPAPMYGSQFTTPGGKALNYSASLRIWLTASRAKDEYIRENDDPKGEVIGTAITARIEKSRFGGFNRECDFDILWSGDKISIQDENSWIDIVKRSKSLTGGGAGWYSLIMEDGSEIKFQGESGFLEKLKDEKFKERVMQIMDQVLIYK
jgi:recombination protein RecA